MPPNGTNKSFIVPERPLIKELGTVTKGRDYSGARLLSGIRGLNHCAVSVGIRQCSVSLAEDSQMSCGPMRTGILAGRGVATTGGHSSGQNLRPTTI